MSGAPAARTAGVARPLVPAAAVVALAGTLPRRPALAAGVIHAVEKPAVRTSN